MPKKNTNARKDTLYGGDVGEKFSFNEQVVSVFDDMISRSVPFYKQTLDLCVEFITLHLHGLAGQGVKDLRVYDIGCSNGNLLIGLSQKLRGLASALIGIDNSQAMVQSATLKAKAYNTDITFQCNDCLKEELLQCNVVVSNYTLQFIRPPFRTQLIKKIYNALESGGIFIMSEKMASIDTVFDSQMITLCALVMEIYTR